MGDTATDDEGPRHHHIVQIRVYVNYIVTKRLILVMIISRARNLMT